MAITTRYRKPLRCPWRLLPPTNPSTTPEVPDRFRQPDEGVAHIRTRKSPRAEARLRCDGANREETYRGVRQERR